MTPTQQHRMVPSEEDIAIADVALQFVSYSHADAISDEYPDHIACRLLVVAEWLRSLPSGTGATKAWFEACLRAEARVRELEAQIASAPESALPSSGASVSCVGV